MLPCFVLRIPSSSFCLPPPSLPPSLSPPSLPPSPRSPSFPLSLLPSLSSLPPPLSLLPSHHQGLFNASAFRNLIVSESRFHPSGNVFLPPPLPLTLGGLRAPGWGPLAKSNLPSFISSLKDRIRLSELHTLTGSKRLEPGRIFSLAFIPLEGPAGRSLLPEGPSLSLQPPMANRCCRMSDPRRPVDLDGLFRSKQ